MLICVSLYEKKSCNMSPLGLAKKCSMRHDDILKFEDDTPRRFIKISHISRGGWWRMVEKLLMKV